MAELCSESQGLVELWEVFQKQEKPRCGMGDAKDANGKAEKSVISNVELFVKKKKKKKKVKYGGKRPKQLVGGKLRLSSLFFFLRSSCNPAPVELRREGRERVPLCKQLQSVPAFEKKATGKPHAASEPLEKRQAFRMKRIGVGSIVPEVYWCREWFDGATSAWRVVGQSGQSGQSGQVGQVGQVGQIGAEDSQVSW